MGTAPLTPEMITEMNTTLDRTRRAAAQPPGGMIQPVTRSIRLSLQPGEALPRLQMAPGNATAMVFSDSTGAPWPVQSFTVADERAYRVQPAGESGRTNMLVISPLQFYAMSNNLIVTLAGHPVPLVFVLETGPRQVDFRVDVSVGRRGPNAAPEVLAVGGLAPTDDTAMRAFGDGTPPRGARKLETSLRDVEAWRFNSMLYIRTPHQLLSPAWVGHAASPSGFRVFSIPDAGQNALPVLYVSHEGRPVFVTVSEGSRR